MHFLTDHAPNPFPNPSKTGIIINIEHNANNVHTLKMIAYHIFIFIFPRSVPTLNFQQSALITLIWRIGYLHSYGRIVGVSELTSMKIFVYYACFSYFLLADKPTTDYLLVFYHIEIILVNFLFFFNYYYIRNFSYHLKLIYKLIIYFLG